MKIHFFQCLFDIKTLSINSGVYSYAILKTCKVQEKVRKKSRYKLQKMIYDVRNNDVTYFLFYGYLS